MKSLFRQALLLAGTVAISSSAMASVAGTPGDLFIAFYSVDSANVVGPDTYFINIGQASLYRESTQSGVTLSTINSGLASSNIATDLAATFGATWANDGNLRWLLIGGTGPSDGTVAGDPARTIYESRGRTSITAGDTTPNTTFAFLSSGNRGTLSTQFSTFRDGINSGINFDNSNTSTSGVNVAGVTIPISNTQTMDEFLPPVTNTYFGVGGDPRQTFATGAIAGGTTLEGALDVYRVIHSATGADLTAGRSNGNATLGNGQYIGTFTIDAQGELRIVGSAPVAGNYYTFATANNIVGGPNSDSDNDGISNLVEYALNTNLTGSDGSVGTFIGGEVKFIKRAAAVTNGDLTYAIQVSDDLGGTDPWENVLSGVTNNASEIKYTLPSGSPKLFARLIVTTSAPAP